MTKNNSNEADINEIDAGTAVDVIVQFNGLIVAGGYDYDAETGKRTGKIIVVDPTTKKIIKSIDTTGTFCLDTHGNRLFSADTSNISIYDHNFNLVSSIQTSHITTYINCGTFINTTNTNGEFIQYDYNLNLINKIQVSTGALWVVKEIGDRIYMGTESGITYIYYENGLFEFGDRRTGIIDFYKHGNNIVVSSYDDNLEMFEQSRIGKEYKNRNKIENIGSLWKIHGDETHIYAASMYDGLKIFDHDFNLVKQIQTNSICYGLCITETAIFYSSFYENKIFCIGKQK